MLFSQELYKIDKACKGHRNKITILKSMVLKTIRCILETLWIRTKQCNTYKS